MNKKFYDVAFNFPANGYNQDKVNKHIKNHKADYSRYVASVTSIVLWCVPEAKRKEIIMPILKVLKKANSQFILQVLRRS